MRGTVKELLSVVFGLVGLFLVVEHYTGFSKDVGALSTGGVGLVKALQGR